MPLRTPRSAAHELHAKKHGSLPLHFPAHQGHRDPDLHPAHPHASLLLLRPLLLLLLLLLLPLLLRLLLLLLPFLAPVRVLTNNLVTEPVLIYLCLGYFVNHALDRDKSAVTSILPKIIK